MRSIPGFLEVKHGDGGIFIIHVLYVYSGALPSPAKLSNSLTCAHTQKGRVYVLHTHTHTHIHRHGGSAVYTEACALPLAQSTN